MRTIATVAGVMLMGLLALTGCSSVPLGDGITDLTLAISVTTDANPDDSGRGSPIYLTLYELRDTGSFDDADYLEMYRDARSVLAGSLVDMTEIGPLFPGTDETRELRLNTATVAIGIMGGFNRYSEMTTAVTVATEPGKDLEIELLVDRTGLRLR